MLNEITMNYRHRIAKWCNTLVHLGVEMPLNEAVITDVWMTNMICLIIISLILTVGGGIVWLTKDPAIGYPAAIELSVACSVLVLNQKRKYTWASGVLFLSQYVAIPYFTMIMGEGLPVGSLIIFLISIIYLIFRDPGLRKICLTLVMLLYLVLEAIVYVKHVHPHPLQPELFLAFRTQLMANCGVILLVLLVSRPYVSSRDLQVQLQKSNRELEETNKKLNSAIIEWGKANAELEHVNQQLGKTNGQLEMANSDLEKANSDLAHANRFVRIFVFEIAHELRNAFAPVVYIHKELETEISHHASSDHQRYLLQLLGICSRNLLSIIKNILDLSRIESGKGIRIHDEAFVFRKHFSAYTQVLKIMADYKSKKLVVVFDDTLPEVLIADDARLGQVLNNLVSNAYKFGNEGSVIRISFARQGNSLAMSVTNEGEAIALEVQGRMFELFGADAPSQVESSGLGLYIVKKIITSMGGTVSLQSDDEFTQVTATVPLKPGTVNDLPKVPDISGVDIKGLHVLIADDDHMIPQLLLRQLRGAGFIVTLASDGGEAIRYIQQESPDLLILDYQMPVRNGAQVLEFIRSTEQFKGIPVIMAGEYPDELKDELFALGVLAIVEKPIEKETVIHLLHQHMQLTGAHKITGIPL